MVSKNNQPILFVIFLFLCFGGFARAEQNNQFSNFFNSFNSLSTPFKQYTYDASKNLLATSLGILTVKKPNQLRWHILKPDEQILLLNQQQLWLYDVELEQASAQQLDKLKKTPLYWLLKKPTNIDNLLVFSYQEGDVKWYQVAQNSAPYKNLSLAFKNHILHAISLDNALGQSIVVIFNQIKTNVPTSTAQFVLPTHQSIDIIQ